LKRSFANFKYRGQYDFRGKDYLKCIYKETYSVDEISFQQVALFAKSFRWPGTEFHTKFDVETNMKE